MTPSSVDRSENGHITSLANFETPNLEMIAKRRLQLWAVTLSLLIFTVAVLSLVLFWQKVTLEVWSPRLLVFVGIVLLVVLFSAYAIAKELQLRASTKELMEENVLGLGDAVRETGVTASDRRPGAMALKGGRATFRILIDRGIHAP